ncbi:hypothetical protein GCM10023067_12260 [Aminobacter aganoensis]
MTVTVPVNAEMREWSDAMIASLGCPATYDLARLAFLSTRQAVRWKACPKHGYRNPKNDSIASTITTSPTR